MISSFECGVVLIVVLCGDVWFHVLLRCSFGSYWKISFSQSHIQLMIWMSTLQIQEHEHCGDFDFIILFLGIFLLYAINLDVVSLFAALPFTFLAMLIMLLYMMYPTRKEDRRRGENPNSKGESQKSWLRRFEVRGRFLSL